MINNPRRLTDLGWRPWRGRRRERPRSMQCRFSCKVWGCVQKYFQSIVPPFAGVRKERRGVIPDRFGQIYRGFYPQRFPEASEKSFFSRPHCTTTTLNLPRGEHVSISSRVSAYKLWLESESTDKTHVQSRMIRCTGVINFHRSD